MVVGHTPQVQDASAFVSTYDTEVIKKYPYLTRINSACGNRIYRIDTMMSRAFSINVKDYREVQYGRLNALEINLNEDGSTGKIYNIYHTGEDRFGKTEHIQQIREI
jgi:hypothetical protein